MIKGAQKRMIVVKTADSRVFEEAYFVMRSDMTASGEDMVSEANKIIESCNGKRHERWGHMSVSILIPICTFVGGSIFGGFVTLLLMLVSG